MAGAVIRAQLRLEGGNAFKQDFEKAASAVKKANAEVGYFTSALDKNGKSQEALAGKTKALDDAFEAEQKVIDRITARIQELSEMTGVDTTQAVDELTAELYKHKKAQAELGDQVDDTTEDFQEFATQAGATSAIVSKALDIAWDIGKRIFNIGKDAVMYNAQMESYAATISAFFRTAGQGAEEAEANTAQLIAKQKELSLQVGIGADKLIEANKLIIAAGKSGDESQRAISALAKAIVATGGGNEQLSNMAVNLQQIANNITGATGQDIKQFAMAGIDLWNLMAESTGKTVEQLKEMDITFDMVVDALDKATQEGGKFFEASQAGASTVNGQMNKLKATIQDGLGTAFQPFNDALKNEILPQAQELVEGIDWVGLGEMMSDAAIVATETFGVLVKTLDELARTYGIVKTAVKDWGNVQGRVTTDVANGYIGTAGAFKRAYDEHQRFASGTQSGLNTIKDKVTDVNKTIAGMPTAWTAAIPGAQSAGNQIANAVKGPLQSVANEAYTWGSHAGSGFASGINYQVPVIATAAARAANAVRQVMAFTRPEKGPLHEYEQWMPHMMEGFARGIDDNLWRVQEAASNVAGTIAYAANPVTNYNGGINIAVNAAAGQSADEIADVVMVKLQRATTQRRAVWA